MTPAETDVLAACDALRAHRQQGEVVLEQRDRALRALWVESGMPKRRVGDAVNGLLADHGWSADDIRLVGVSGPSVLAALDRRRT